jgi:hypothetical protein
VIGFYAVITRLRTHQQDRPALFLGSTNDSSSRRDLTEPLAVALVAVAVLAWDDRRAGRLILSAALFALAALTRETSCPHCFRGRRTGGPEIGLRRRAAGVGRRHVSPAVLSAGVVGPRGAGMYGAAVVPRALVPAVPFGWSLGWYLPAERHYGLSGMKVITT